MNKRENHDVFLSLKKVARCGIRKLYASEPENSSNDRGNHNRDDGMRFPQLDNSIEDCSQ
jgi:hypothetical protein